MSFLNGSAIQPINFNIIATADATGTATFAFEAVALSNTWTGTLNCATAPDTAQFTAVSGATTFGQFKGANSYGPVQLQVGDQLNVNATGLVPDTQYSLTLLGVNHVVVEPPITWPAPYADSVTTSTEQIYLGSAGPQSGSSAAFPSKVITLQPTWRSIWLLAAWTDTGEYNYVSITPKVVGNQTGLTYKAEQPPFFISPSTRDGAFYRFPIIDGPDTSVTVTWTISDAGDLSNGYVYYGADLATLDVGVYQEGNWEIASYTYGGKTTQYTTTSSTAITNLIDSPGAGYSIRLQSVTLEITGTFPTTNAQYLWLQTRDASTYYPVANMIIPATSATIVLNGLLLADDASLLVQAPNSTAAKWTVSYDYISTPTIS